MKIYLLRNKFDGQYLRDKVSWDYNTQQQLNFGELKNENIRLFPMRDFAKTSSNVQGIDDFLAVK